MWPDELETRILLDRVEHHDKGAAEQLWAEHRAALRRVIGHRLDPALARRVDASDVVQEVLMKANQRLPEYLKNPPLPFHLWLRQIARDISSTNIASIGSRRVEVSTASVRSGTLRARIGLPSTLPRSFATPGSRLRLRSSALSCAGVLRMRSLALMKMTAK